MRRAKPDLDSGLDRRTRLFWNSKGKRIARRNLIWSIALAHRISVWLIWSIVATKSLPQAGSIIHPTTVPARGRARLSAPDALPLYIRGHDLRGRTHIFSAAVLFIPTSALAYFVSQPDTPFC